MKLAVVNLARGSWYPKGQARLQRSLDRVGFTGDFLGFTHESQVDAPMHSEAPYAFKPRALWTALERGYDLVLWCDCSVWALRSLDSVFARIADEGHMFFVGWTTGEWSSDAALAYFGLSRDVAFTVPMLMALCMGLDLRRPRSKEFLKRWLDAIPTFPGAWTNERRQVSRDPRVLGHRHDQTAASIIAWQLGMDLIVPQETHLYQAEFAGLPEDGSDPRVPACVSLLAQGM